MAEMRIKLGNHDSWSMVFSLIATAWISSGKCHNQTTRNKRNPGLTVRKLSCVTFGNSFNLLEPQFPQLSNRKVNIFLVCLTDLLWGLKRMLKDIWNSELPCKCKALLSLYITPFTLLWCWSFSLPCSLAHDLSYVFLCVYASYFLMDAEAWQAAMKSLVFGRELSPVHIFAGTASKGLCWIYCLGQGFVNIICSPVVMK